MFISSYFKGETFNSDVLTAAASVLTFGIQYFGFRMAFISLGVFKSVNIVILSLTISSLFAILQFLAYIFEYTLVFHDITSFFSSSDIVWSGRSRGLAFEPSWLASQLTVIGIPVLMYRVLIAKSHSVFFVIGKTKFKSEWLLLFINGLGLLLTFSRAGIVASSFSFLIALLYLSRNAFNVRNIILTVSVVLAGIAIIASATKNTYFASLITGIERGGSLREVFVLSNAGPRYAAWESAIDSFVEHPLFGVGLGIQHRYFALYPPTWSVELPEVKAWISDSMPDKANAKSLLFRLAAEGGGVAILIWMIIWLTVYQGLREKMLFWMIFPALIIDQFSLDSLSLAVIPLLLVTLTGGALNENKRNNNKLQHWNRVFEN